MRNVHNEAGVALVTVLLIVTVLSVLGLSVVGMAINNSKQTRQIETNIQTLDLAEMGYTYYVTSFSDFYERKIRSVMQDSIAQIKEDIIKNLESDPSLKEDEDFIEGYRGRLAIELRAALVSNDFAPLSGSGLVHFKEIDANRSFNIYVNEIEASADNLQLNFISEGIFNDFPTREISSTITIPIPSINLDGVGSGAGNLDSNDGAIRYEDRIPTPEGLPQCEYNKKTFGTKSCSYRGAVSTGSSVDIENVTILIGGSGTFNSSINKGINNSTLYIRGSATFNNPINGIQNSQLYVGGAVRFDNINRGIDDSLIVVMGSATFDRKIDAMSTSTIYVKGSATFYGKINLGNNAKICVGGNVGGIPKSSGDNIFSPTIDRNAYNANCSGGPGDATSPGGKPSSEDIEIIWEPINPTAASYVYE